VPQLADEGLYLASESTLYRLQRHYGIREKPPRVRRTDVTRASTVHRAVRPNQVWSWDITWLPTNVRGIYLHLYLMMDVWSRRIVGWRIADGLVLHSDNGKPMRASTMIATLQWLGIVPSFSRPHVSDDANISAAQRWVARFADWYNEEHRHSGIRYVTPNERHEGRERDILGRRHQLYELARRSNPERWISSTRNWNPIGGPQPARRRRRRHYLNHATTILTPTAGRINGCHVPR
jgi:putative transposase